jgi:processed acidic surface protein
MQNIADYFMTLEAYFSDPAVLERFEALGERLLAMDATLLTEEITEEQIADFISIYEEALSILKLKMKFSILKDGSETPLSVMDLFSLKELDDNELKISIYGENSQFLADYLITRDFIDSIGGILEETEDIIEAVDLPPVTKPDKHVSTAVKTVNGGKLPKTATNYIPNALIGLFIAFVGILMYRKVRNGKSGYTK